MKKILHIISSPRGDASMSIKLGNAIIEKIQAGYPGSSVHEHNLVTQQFPHLEESHLTSFFTPAESRTPADLTAIQHSEEAIAEIRDADIIVIGVPIYNFNIPSTLKAWLDHIVRRGVTFKYDENGPQGLLDNRKVYLALSSGGVFSEGPMTGLDFAVPYLKHLLGFIGLNDVTVVRAEGLSIPGIQDSALEKGINSVVIA
ncbi:FMN-dependent NADH-azoreductase [Mucilaginibacter terrigena]|uniref:FMN dependent NADH:quinone oxidoreductase n=1 Tax=Mucilaginibacter terrigena TaxID=2492395 RepID=A0A4Q5LL65_9SPHI|nr:NAD(P)H-dependent oxidoreductase [Mucilaginibacter terrigena]RYU89422.1 FMN-dependent NADH-azoreductase [Mucilaginibacter terrigena]